MADYNSSFSHTRTTIFKDTSFTGPVISGGAITFHNKAIDSGAPFRGCNPCDTTPLTLFSSGDTIIVFLYFLNVLPGGCATITDSQANSYMLRVSSSGLSASEVSTCIFTATAGTQSPDTIHAACIHACSPTALDYSGITGFGNTGTDQQSPPGGVTSTVSITVSAGSSVVEVIGASCAGCAAGQNPVLTPSSSQTTRDGPFSSSTGMISTWRGLQKDSLTAGANTFSVAVTFPFTTAPCCSVSHVGLELKTTGGVQTFDFSKTRWNFNSTCVAMNSIVSFVYSGGVSGLGGNNCNSADIIISKTTVNLQAGAAKMLEFDTAWKQGSGGFPSPNLNRLDFVLRTNATLPSFMENYDAFNDTQARFIWSLCNNAGSLKNPCSTVPGVNTVQDQAVWIAHDQRRTIFQEAFANDFIIQSDVGQFQTGNLIENQLVLNFTGPNNYLNSQFTGTSSNVSQNLASQFQFGQDFNILVKAVFNTAGTPNSADVAFFGTTTISPLPAALGIFSVPSSCTDPANKSACSLATAQPVFDFNPLDPSSWGNAIIKGLLWVFTIAVPQGLGLVVSVVLQILQIVLNQIGGFIGWGNIGDQFFNFANGVITYFTTGLGDALGWLPRLILRSIDLIKAANNWVNFYLTGLQNFLADVLNVIVELVTFAQKIVTFLGNSYVLIMILFFLWYDADEGLAGWYNWFETTKWMAFISYDFLERMINFGISSITWLFGRIPTLDGTTLPELPTIAIGGGPHFPTFEMTALREGNFASMFGMVLGVSFMIWFETSGLPGSIGANVPSAPVNVMAPFVNIFLILISVMGLLFILNIPAKMARGAFGLDDITHPKLSSFSTGPVRTGGVSGHAARRHPERKARIVINRGLGVRGLVPQVRRHQQTLTPEQQATA